LIGGEVAPALQLDLLEAASRHEDREVQDRLAKFEAARKSNDPLATFREALEGGDAARGRTIFYERTAASCLRCHKINTRGGEVGPDLTHIAKDKNREYLLESLVIPNRKIAEGFESVVIATTDGQSMVGVLKGEDDRELRLMTSEGIPIVVPKNEIEERARGPSAMPEDVMKHLTKRELRDLVEFLAGQN
jgi:quinoprotein glucose dehydrogenase